MLGWKMPLQSLSSCSTFLPSSIITRGPIFSGSVDAASCTSHAATLLADA
jgi:hypothetical protein